MSDKKIFEYDELMFREDVGQLKEVDIAMLADYYPTYWQKNWRLNMLHGLKDGLDVHQIFLNKLHDKQIDIESDQSKGGHVAMIPHKIWRAAVRLLYLRYRQRDLTPTQARKQIRKIDRFKDVLPDTLLRNVTPNLYDEKHK